MSIFELVWWFFIAWWLSIILKGARQAWSQHPDNPSRVFLAEFSGLLIFMSVLWVVAPFPFHSVTDEISGNTMRMVSVDVGFGTVKRGEWVAVKPDYLESGHYDGQLIALPNDELTTVDGIIYINGVALASEPTAFPKFSTDCVETIPENHIATIDGLSIGSRNCDDIYIYPVDNLIDHCLFVYWPLSTSCGVPTNNIPEHKVALAE